MIKRIIEVSNHSYLHLKQRQLIIEQEKIQVTSVPIEDIGALILAHPAIVITQQLVIACGQEKVAIIFCDEHYLPYSIILPLQANKLHQKILQQQIEMTQPIKKRLWQQIVKQKIQKQSNTLQFFDKPYQKLKRLALEVKSNDSTQCEATAARYYWKALFDKSFNRDQNLDGINALLNYGYSIIRAMVARSICGAGLHPALGLFHHNQYNALCLADDLMEPLRPLVDAITYKYTQEHTVFTVNKTTKTLFLNLLNQSVFYNNEQMPLMISLHYLMANLKRNYSGEIKQLKYPEIHLKTLL